jgi:hypothetical protein
VARLLLFDALQEPDMNPASEHAALRYLDAAQVVHATGTLDGVEICTEKDECLGAIGGVLVDTAQRLVRYFVLERPSILRKRRYLVSASRDATLSAETGTIYIDADDEVTERFDPASVPRFSDEDLIDTIFAPTAA